MKYFKNYKSNSVILYKINLKMTLNLKVRLIVHNNHQGLVKI